MKKIITSLFFLAFFHVHICIANDFSAILTLSEIKNCDETYIRIKDFEEKIILTNFCVEEAIKYYSEIHYSSCNREAIRKSLTDLMFELVDLFDLDEEKILKEVGKSLNLEFLVRLCREYSCGEE